MARKAVYMLEPAGLMDRTDARVTAYAGEEVQVIQPPGTPRNGTFGMTYVQTVDGDFIGLVSKNSLRRTGRTAEVRDRAKEARDARSAAICRSVR